MYGTTHRNPSPFDSRERDERADYTVANSREDGMLANIRLSRFERGLLAFDRLVRRMAKQLQNVAR
jgi:hypothetical protein